MTPEVTVHLDGASRATPDGLVLLAGSRLSGSVQVRASEPVKCRRLVVEVGWQTSGKGDRDQGWIVQEIAGAGSLEPGAVHPFECELPLGPVTYRGHLLKIDWSVRARIDRPWAFDAKGEAGFVVVA